MTLEQEFIPGQVIAELRQDFESRMHAKNIPPEEVARLIDFLGKMVEIASELILFEKTITIPDTDQSVPYDKTTAHQTMRMFCEGLYDAQLRCWEMGIPAELEAQFLKEVAQHVFDDAKQVVVSVNETAKSSLLKAINRYEKTNGTILPKQRGLVG